MGCPGGTASLSYLWSALGTSLLSGGRDNAQLCQGTCTLCLASALPLGVNTLPLTHRLPQDVLGNILLKSGFFSYRNVTSAELSGQL